MTDAAAFLGVSHQRVQWPFTPIGYPSPMPWIATGDLEPADDRGVGVGRVVESLPLARPKESCRYAPPIK